MKIKSKSENRRKYERGQSLVELAISFPIILLLLLGSLDFGMASYAYLNLRDAAQEGALYGSINPNNISEIESRARAISPVTSEGTTFTPVELKDKDLVTVEVTTYGKPCQGITGGKANSITVQVKYDYHLMIPIAESIVGSNTIFLDATATNVIIQPVCK